jgi:hypothetical protein
MIQLTIREGRLCTPASAVVETHRHLLKAINGKDPMLFGQLDTDIRVWEGVKWPLMKPRHLNYCLRVARASGRIPRETPAVLLPDGSTFEIKENL